MTLMRILVDKTTFNGLATDASITLAHNLGGTPDSVVIRATATMASNTSNQMGALEALVGAALVTIRNGGSTTTPGLEVVSMRFHTIIQ